LPGQERFKDLVGNVRVGNVEKANSVQVPYILWGGDVATFLANGDLKTKPGSLFQTAGLDVQLTPGDDFVAQVRNYMEGKTPFLRGTMHMLGLAGEVVGSDPRTKPVVILQLSWSAGDHIVARKGIRSLNDLKGKKIACQQGGPHVGRRQMLKLCGRKTLREPMGLRTFFATTHRLTRVV
jgi:ABC-type amino acid transport substrate-binding protein